MSVIGFDLEITAPISPLENTLTQDGPAIRGIITDQWGIDPTGQPYYDPDGAAPGDAALLSVDENGDLVLTQIASASQAPGGELVGVTASGRRFTARASERVQRAYQHDSDGRLFTADAQTQERSYAHDEDGHLFAGGSPTIDRSYVRRDDGHLFPHAPIHAIPTLEGDE